MLTSPYWPFSWKWHKFPFAMGELGKFLNTIPFIACPLLWSRSLGSFAMLCSWKYHLYLLPFSPRSLILIGHPTASSLHSSFRGVDDLLLGYFRVICILMGFSCFLPQDPLLKVWMTHSWTKFRSSAPFLGFPFSFYFSLRCWALGLSQGRSPSSTSRVGLSFFRAPFLCLHRLGLLIAHFWTLTLPKQLNFKGILSIKFEMSNKESLLNRRKYMLFQEQQLNIRWCF